MALNVFTYAQTLFAKRLQNEEGIRAIHASGGRGW